MFFKQTVLPSKPSTLFAEGHCKIWCRCFSLWINLLMLANLALTCDVLVVSQMSYFCTLLYKRSVLFTHSKLSKDWAWPDGHFTNDTLAVFINFSTFKILAQDNDLALSCQIAAIRIIYWVCGDLVTLTCSQTLVSTCQQTCSWPHFIQPLTLWCVFSLCVIKCHADCRTSFSTRRVLPHSWQVVNIHKMRRLELAVITSRKCKTATLPCQD